ncbi:hypothetical protein K435DRAFT_385771 [Dendrothele bispora CBS 962.96]|uniref:Uncharacterized protein n=1 Tax=Dendrothele bispora (strain CBS 962.96) TaxID=1314807 RepID=A0A4V4HD67_DENBC|nr:hypothetical protein K435DRAFT_385771 [Dendrothele bispora CBS 962.96]
MCDLSGLVCWALVSLTLDQTLLHSPHTFSTLLWYLLTAHFDFWTDLLFTTLSFFTPGPGSLVLAPRLHPILILVSNISI